LPTGEATASQGVVVDSAKLIGVYWCFLSQTMRYDAHNDEKYIVCKYVGVEARQVRKRDELSVILRDFD
jgi:hypothetical protein